MSRTRTPDDRTSDWISRLREPTDEEDAFITERALQDPDNPPLTDEELAQFRPAQLDPEFLAAAEAHRCAWEASPEGQDAERRRKETWDAAMALWREEKRLAAEARATAEAEETERRRQAV